MRGMNVTAVEVVAALMLWGEVSGSHSAFAQARDAVEASPKILLTATLDLMQPPFFGAVESITPEGQLRIGPFKGKPGAEIPANGPLAEGLYLGVVRGAWKDLRDAQLVRVNVTAVLGGGMVVAEVGRGLDRTIPGGKLIFLVRPPQTTSAQMRALPDMVTLEEGPVPMAAGIAADVKAETTATARVDRAAQNLTAIAKAIFGYDDARGCFPPAALIGPDGRAWHSWRVLILPYFDDRSLQAIYNRYSFEEPWDGPQNKQLLESMPHVYTDEPEGKPGDAFTHYAAVTGEGAMFSSEGVAFDPTIKPRRIGHGTRMKDVQDGHATTLMIGTLRSDAQIPWMKPEDVVVGDKPSPLGDKGFFGALYESDKGRYAMFARADGGLAGVSETIAPNAFHALVTIAGRDGVDISKTPGAFLVPTPKPATMGDASPPSKAAAGQRMTIVIFEEDGETKARFSTERRDVAP